MNLEDGNTNLLEETIEILKEHNLKLDDIVWIGCENFYVSLEGFKKLSDTKYDSGYGSPKVAEDLIIVGKNWWLERHEYDGSEWWEFKKIPPKPNVKKKLKALTIKQAEELGFGVSCGWENLSKINGFIKD